MCATLMRKKIMLVKRSGTIKIFLNKNERIYHYQACLTSSVDGSYSNSRER